MDNVGGAGPVTHLTCVEAATGKRKWQIPRFGKGNLIAADGKIFMTTMNGELVIAKADSGSYQELGRMTCLGRRDRPPLSVRGGSLCATTLRSFVLMSRQPESNRFVRAPTGGTPELRFLVSESNQ